MNSLPQPDVSQLKRLALQCRSDSQRWFPELQNGSEASMLAYNTLAMCGESGELANIVKKIQRGSLDLNDKAVRNMAAEELIDVFVYGFNIAGILKIDPQHVYDYKRAVNERRFNRNGYTSA